jgi:Predicted integral membrane protein
MSRRVAVRAAIAAIVLATAGTALLSSHGDTTRPVTTDAERTIAVLPMRSVGGDSLQRDIADGLSDEIADALVTVPGINVVSRRGVGNYRGQADVDAAKIGKALGARFLVSGTLREENGRLIVRGQLLEASTGRMLWSDHYDRLRTDLGRVREEIATAVGDTVRRILGLTPGVRHAVAHTPEAEAYRLYVLAQRALYWRGLSIKPSADMFRQATVRDTLYADAFSGLSMALALSPYFVPVSMDSVIREATSTAEHALRLDPTLLEPHIALGLTYQHAYQWDRAGVEFRKAIAIDGRDVEARVQYGRHLVFRERATEALEQFLAARREDPASALVSSWVSYTYYVRDQIDSAVAESIKAFQSDSTNTTTLSLGALVRLRAGRVREARQFVERGQQMNESLFYVLSALGDSALAMARLRKFDKALHGFWRAETNRAFAMLGAKDTARALTALERATDRHEIWPTLVSMRDPIFDPIRASPRFQRLLSRVGLQ